MEELQAINPEERLEMCFGKGKIYYRRIQYDKVGELEVMATKKGKIDPILRTTLLLKHCILGWEGIKFVDGKELEFKPENIRCIPSNALAMILIASNANSEWEKESLDVKN